MRKIGMSLAAMILKSERDTIEVVEKMAESGFQATFTAMLEMDRQVAVAELLNKNGIQYESLHAPSANINDMWLPGDAGEAKLNEFKKCAEHAHAAGAGIIVVHLSSGENAPPVTDIGRDRFTRLVEHADKLNVSIAFENQRKISNIAWAFETFPKGSNVGFCGTAAMKRRLRTEDSICLCSEIGSSVRIFTTITVYSRRISTFCPLTVRSISTESPARSTNTATKAA